MELKPCPFCGGEPSDLLKRQQEEMRMLLERQNEDGDAE